MISIIIPTHNRELILSRAIEYYKNFEEFEIIICDSSFNINKKHEYINVKHLHLPNINFAKKIEIALNYSKYNFVCLSPDDDFLIKESLIKAMIFLKSNRKFSSVHGYFFQFELNSNNIKYNFIYPQNHIREITNSSPVERVNKLINPHMQLLYSLHRKENILSFVVLAAKTKEITNLELSSNLITPLFGFHKTMNILWMLRDKKRYTTYNTSEKNINTVILNYKYYFTTDEGISFYDIILNFYSNFLKLSISDSKTYLNKIIAQYLLFEEKNKREIVVSNKIIRALLHRINLFKNFLLNIKLLALNSANVKSINRIILKHQCE